MPNITRDQLFSLPESGRRDEFIEIATHALNAQPEDAEVRFGLIRSLTESGLLHRAASFADAFDPEVLGAASLNELLQQLRVPTQNGSVDWRLQSPTFDRNLHAIEARYDWAQRLRKAFDHRRASLELHKTRNGRWEVFDASDSVWRPCFGSHQPTETFENLRRQVENRVMAPIIIDGVGLGGHLPLYVMSTHQTLNSSAPFVYQVESDWTALAIALHLFDWSELIADPRVVLCVGEDAYEQLDAAIAHTPNAPLPKSIIWTPPWNPTSTSRGESIIRAHTEQRAKSIAELRAALDRQYADRDVEHWGTRFQAAIHGDGPPLRVLSIACRFTTVLQFATRDALAALASIGCETRVVIEPDDQSHISPIVALEAIRDFEPDLILLIDHTRASQPEILIQNVPVLTWIQDRLPWLFDSNVGQSLGELDFVMGQGKRDLVQRYAYPEERFYGCDMATDVVRLTSPSAVDGDPARFDCDVAFATHASETPREFADGRRAECDNPTAMAVLDAIENALVARQDRGELNGALNFSVLLSEIEASMGTALSATARDGMIDHFARPLAERMIRQETIRWAANWARATGGRLHIYGDGWERHPEFAEFARGTLEHGPELGEAFRRAKVNLHSGCNFALHQRVLDGLAAGGFFIARRHAGDIGFPVMRAIRAFLVQRGISPPATIYGVDLPAPWHSEFERLCRMKGVDPKKPLEINDRNMRRIESVCEGETIMLADQLWPEFEALTFSCEAEFVDRLEYYIQRPDERRARVSQMRKGVIEHFGYETLMRCVLDFTAERLSSAPSDSESRAPQNEFAVVEANA